MEAPEVVSKDTPAVEEIFTEAAAENILEDVFVPMDEAVIAEPEDDSIDVNQPTEVLDISGGSPTAVLSDAHNIADSGVEVDQIPPNAETSVPLPAHSDNVADGQHNRYWKLLDNSRDSIKDRTQAKKLAIRNQLHQVLVPI